MVNIWCEPYRCRKNEWKKSDRNQCAKKNIKIAAKASPGQKLLSKLYTHFIRNFSCLYRPAIGLADGIKNLNKKNGRGGNRTHRRRRLPPPHGFEDRKGHQTLSASGVIIRRINDLCNCAGWLETVQILSHFKINKYCQISDKPVFFIRLNQESTCRKYNRYIAEVRLETLAKIGIIAGVVAASTAVLALIRLIYRGHKEKKQKHTTHFHVSWKKSSDLTPEDVLGIRAKDKLNFNPAYMERPEVDPVLRSSIAKGDCVLIVGNPLAGKTRAVYEALKKMSKPASVLIPRPEDIRPGEFEIPDKSKFFFNPVVIFDDINKFASKQNFEYLFNLFVQEGAIIIATCRKGEEYDRFCDGHDSIMQAFDRTIVIPKVKTEEAKGFAEKNNIESSGYFDGNIGSLFVNIDAMRERYSKCSNDQKGILAAIRRLYDAGIYEGHEEFELERIKLVSEKCEEVSLNKQGWQDLLRQLSENGFIDRNNGTVRVEETYLQKVIQADLDFIDNFKELKDIFVVDPKALFLLGNHAYYVAQYVIRPAIIAHIAIDSYNAALNTWTLNASPDAFGTTQTNLGNAYTTLAEFEDKKVNAIKAITAFNEALTVRTPDKSPIGYAANQNNLGNAYCTLAEVDYEAAIAHKAIEAYNEALRVYTLDKFPMAFGLTKNNLGTAYKILAEAEAEAEDKATNAKKAIMILNEASKVHTPENFPIQFAKIQANLATVYCILANVEDPVANSKKAITAFNLALNVYTLDKFPRDYGTIQNNLGYTYRTLAEVEDKAANLHNAIRHHNISLSIYKRNNFPIQFAMYSYNLGLAHIDLAGIENKEMNRNMAEEIFSASLEVFKSVGIDEGVERCKSALAYMEKLRNNI